MMGPISDNAYETDFSDGSGYRVVEQKILMGNFLRLHQFQFYPSAKYILLLNLSASTNADTDPWEHPTLYSYN